MALTVIVWGEFLLPRAPDRKKTLFWDKCSFLFHQAYIIHKYSQVLSSIYETAKIYCIKLIYFLNIWIVFHEYYQEDVKGTVLCVTLMYAVIAGRKQGKQLLF